MHCSALQFTSPPSPGKTLQVTPALPAGQRAGGTNPPVLPCPNFQTKAGLMRGRKSDWEPRQPRRRSGEAPRLPPHHPRRHARGPGGAAPPLGHEGESVGRGHPSPCLPLPVSVRLPAARWGAAGGAHSPRRGRRASGQRAAGPERGAARSGAPPPRRPRNAAPHRAMQPGQRHNTPRDISRPAIGRRAEGRARQPLSGAVTPAAREGAAGAHTPRTHSHKDRRAALHSVRGAGSGGAGQVARALATGLRRRGKRGATPATAPAAAVHWPPGEGCESKLRLPWAAPRGNGRGGAGAAGTAPLGPSPVAPRAAPR